MKYFKLKFLLLFFALAAALPPAWAETVTDVITVQATGINLSSSGYQEFTDLKSYSDAVYAGKIARGQSTSNPSIQLRSSNSDAGIITTTSGGKAKSVTITFNSYTEKYAVNILGKNSAYSSASDLFDNSKKGTLLGTTTKLSTTINIEDDYEYIGIASNSGAVYIDKIEIVWETEGGDTPTLTDVTLSYSQTSCEATLGEAFNAPTLTVDPVDAASEVVYSSSNTNVATIATDGTVTLVGPGTTTITAAISDSETYTDATASYELTVTEPVDPSLKCAILNFTDKEYWTPNLPNGSSNKTVDEISYYDGTYTVKIAGSSGQGYYYYPNNTDLLLGKQGAYIILPALNGEVKKIEVIGPPTGTNGVSGKVAQNIFVGTDAVSTETIGAFDSKTYVIDNEHQAKGTIYTLKVTNDNNTQIRQIKIYYKESATPEPAEAELSYAQTAFTAVANGEFTAPVLVNPHGVAPITYSSSDENVALVDETTGEVVIGKAGEATITASFAGNDNYKADEASYTITVSKAQAGLSYGETTAFTVYAGNEFTAPTLTNPNKLTVTYSSSDEEVAMVDETTGEVVLMDKVGDATITAAFAGNDYYEAATATYTIHVIAKQTVTMAFNPTEVTVYADDEEIPAPVLTPENLTVKYSSSDEEVAMVDEATGEVVLMGKIGTTTITANYAGDQEHAANSASYTLTVEKRPEIVVDNNNLTFNAKVGETTTATFQVLGTDLKNVVNVTLNDESGAYSVDAESISIEAAEDGATVTVTYAPAAEGTHTATITLSTKDAKENATVTLTGTAVVPETLAMPTLSLMGGTYDKAQQLTITAVDGAKILYSTDGSEPTTEYTGAIELGDGTTTVKAIAVKDGYTNSPMASATYIIDIPAELPTIDPIKGYYSIKNNGNGKYANVAGRKTLNFTSTPDKMAGTVIYVETNDKGQVQSLRSQAADLQGYADRAMRYVPEIVKIVAEKLHAEGDGQILGDEGLDAIMEKFNESFDHHLYVEQAEGGYRLYGKTPSMQPVVDFYREHTHQVETKLPMLEGFINSALKKLRDKIGGSSVFTDFSLHQIWKNMGSTLTEPVDDATTMAFYREVLNNKNYVWDFAYQTAMIYLNNVKSHPRWSEIESQLGEYAQYIDMIEQVRPDFKYYIVQKNDKPDFISQGNKDIINNEGRTLWTLEPRAEFMVNFPETNLVNGKYVTTLYTDFAYDLPEGVTAYIVSKVNTFGEAETTALEGTVPAQTPVLLKADAAGVKALTITTSNAKAPAENLLVGADYFIKQYGINTPEVEGLFDMVKEYLGESFYNSYMTQYEHLMLKTAGTVNNKYLWGLSNDDLSKCIYGEDGDCEVRTLSTGDKGVGFYMTWTAPANQAFLASKQYNPVKLTLRGDVDRDGDVDINDVTALIDILLGTDTPEDNYDYEAADFDMDGKRNIDDVTSMIDYLLGKKVID